MYVVINRFDDLEDKRHSYYQNELYPFEKKEVKKERIDILMGADNKLKKPLIKEISIDEMDEKQLVEFAAIEGIDLKELILEEIKNRLNENPQNEKEFKALLKKAKNKKIDVPENSTIDELKKLVNAEE